MARVNLREVVAVVGSAYAAGQLSKWISGSSLLCTLGGFAMGGFSVFGYLVKKNWNNIRAEMRAEVITIDWGRLPVLSVGEIIENEDADPICTICSSGLIDIQMADEPLEVRAVVKMPDCGHKFHRPCAMNWLRQQQENNRRLLPLCANCRQPVTTMLAIEEPL